MAGNEIVSTSQEQQGQEHQLDLPSSTTTTTSRSFLVKVYKKTSEGEADWQDQGTGFCAYKTGVNDQEPDEIFVQNEKDDSPLLISQVTEHKGFLKQQETVIVWNEDTANKLALSFLKPDGCTYIWNRIRERLDTATGDRLRTAVGEMMDTDDDRTPPMMNDSQEVALLPMPELSNLDEIKNIISSTETSQDKDRLASFIVQEDYIDKLVSVFESCEKMKRKKKNLQKLYTIMKSIILLNGDGIIEQIVRDGSIMGVLGILESDPEIPDKKATHRKNLAKLSQQKPVVPIEDVWANFMIQQTLRLKYLRDAVLCDTIDDSLASTLDSLISENEFDIVDHFENDHGYLEKLFQIFKHKDSSDEMKKEASMFVIQLWVLADVYNIFAREALARTLAEHGLFNMFPFALSANDEILRTHATNVLDSIVHVNPRLVRAYTIEQTQTTDAENTTLGTVLKQFALEDTDPGLKIRYAGIIKTLMDFCDGRRLTRADAVEMLLLQDPDTQSYVDEFYKSYCDLFLRPFEQVDVKPIKLDGPIEELELTQDQSDLCLSLCDLICFALRQHADRSKILIRSTDCFMKITQLYRCRQSHVKLAALRVFRTCIGLDDEVYTRYLLELNVFEPTMRVFLDTNGRNNALNSACLEMLEYIGTENIELLVEHLITNYGSVLDSISYVTIPQLLRLQHELNIIRNDSDDTGEESAGESNSEDISSIDDTASEEEYFNNQSSDEEEDQPNTASAESASSNKAPPAESPRGGPPVSYNGSDSSDEEIDSDEEEQTITTSSASPLADYELCRSSSPDSNENSNNNNNNSNVANNNKNTTATIADIAESAVSKSSSSPSPPPPTLLGTTTTTTTPTASESEAEEQQAEQQAERAVSPPPPSLPRRRKYEDDNEDNVSATQAEREIKKRKHTPPPTSCGTIATTTTTTAAAAEEQQAEQQTERAVSPPPSLSRRRKYEDDDEGDVSATQAERQTKKRKHTPPPTSLGATTTATGAEEQQAECAVSPLPPSSRRRKYDDDDEGGVSAARDERETKKRKRTPPPTSIDTTTTTTNTTNTAAAAEAEEQQADRALSSPPLSRGRTYEDGDKENVLAALTGREKKKTERTPQPTSLGTTAITTIAASRACSVTTTSTTLRRKYEYDDEGDASAAQTEREKQEDGTHTAAIGIIESVSEKDHQSSDPRAAVKQ